MVMKNTADKISEYMTTNLLTVNPYTPVRDARAMMVENSIRHLPVVDRLGQVVGVISDRDLAVVHGDLEVAFRMNEVTNIVNVGEELNAVIEQMIQSKVSSCMIEDDGKLVGIVTSEDLLRVLKSHLDKPARGSIRTVLYDYVLRYPLGSAVNLLSTAGI